MAYILTVRDSTVRVSGYLDQIPNLRSSYAAVPGKDFDEALVAAKQAGIAAEGLGPRILLQ